MRKVNWVKRNEMVFDNQCVKERYKKNEKKLGIFQTV